MNTAFESTKAGLLQAIAHQQGKSREVIVHELRRTADKTVRRNVKREVTPALSVKR